MVTCLGCKALKHVTIFPYHCYCGKIYHGTNKPQRQTTGDPLACIHRGGPIGEIDCGCQGKPLAYSCQIHGQCGLRKLKPGLPRIKYNDGTESTHEIKFCNACSDRQPFDPSDRSCTCDIPGSGV